MNPTHLEPTSLSWTPILAWCVFISFPIAGIALVAMKKMDWKALSPVLVFASVAFLLIQISPVVNQISYGNLVVNTTKVIEESRDSAIAEIESHKELLHTLLRQGNDLSNRLEKQTEDLDKSIEDALLRAKKLELTELRLNALDGSRFAFDEICKRVSAESGEEKALLERTIGTLRRKHAKDQMYTSYEFSSVSVDGIEIPIERATIEQITVKWPGNGPHDRQGIIDTLRSKNDRDAIPFVIEKLKSEEDLEVCAAIGRCLEALSGIEKEWMDFSFWLSTDFEVEAP